MIVPPLPSLDASLESSPIYYRTVPQNYTSIEYWRIVGLRGVFLVWWKKLNNKPLWSFDGVPSPSLLRADGVSRQELSTASLQALDELVHACEPLGFGNPFYYANKHNLVPADSAQCSLRQSSGETSAILSYLQSYKRNRRPHHLVTFSSSLADERSLVTCNRRRLFDHPPSEDRSYLPGLSVLTLYLEHCRRLENHRAQGNPPVPVRTLEEFEAFCWREDWRFHEFRTARGVYVPMSPAEVEQARTRKAASQAEWLAGR